MRRTVDAGGGKAIRTLALLVASTNSVGSRCTLGHCLPSLRITVRILGALHRGIYQVETLVAFRASVCTIDRTIVACCRCAVKTVACLCRCSGGGAA